MFRSLFRTRTLLFTNYPYSYRIPYHEFSPNFIRTRTRTQFKKNIPYSVLFPHPKSNFYSYTLHLPFLYFGTEYGTYTESVPVLRGMG